VNVKSDCTRCDGSCEKWIDKYNQYDIIKCIINQRANMFTHVDIQELPKIIQKTKSDGTRKYQVPGGNEYPSVTTILGAKEKPWLEEWRQMLGPKNAAKETKRCSDRGTAVHNLAEEYLNNKESDMSKYDPLHIKDFNKLKISLNNIDNIRAQEIGLYSDVLKTAGTVDCVAEYNGKLSIIDFKTSTNFKKRGMIDDYFKQCCAYSICWHERTGIMITNLVVMIAVERGLLPLVFEDNIQNWFDPLVSDIDKFYK